MPGGDGDEKAEEWPLQVQVPHAQKWNQGEKVPKKVPYAQK